MRAWTDQRATPYAKAILNEYLASGSGRCAMDSVGKIERLDAVRAVAEPNRLAILRLLIAAPHTLTMLGEALDKHPAWVRHHVKALESAGLVKLGETRTTRNYTEKFYAATSAAFQISMLVRPDERFGKSVVALVSHDMAVELLSDSGGGHTGPDRTNLATAVTGSLDGLIGVRQGLADIAGCHLLDAGTGEYNIPYVRHLFPDRDIMVVSLTHREQGLMVAPGNPLSLRDFSDVVEKACRFVNRNRGSGTRVWIDRAITAAGATPSQVVGYDRVVDTHTAAAQAVARGEADAAIGIAVAAEQAGIGFVPLFRERYDLVMTEDSFETDKVAQLVDRLHSKTYRTEVAKITGYDPDCMGNEHRLST